MVGWFASLFVPRQLAIASKVLDLVGWFVGLFVTQLAIASKVLDLVGWFVGLFVTQLAIASKVLDLVGWFVGLFTFFPGSLFASAFFRAVQSPTTTCQKLLLRFLMLLVCWLVGWLVGLLACLFFMFMPQHVLLFLLFEVHFSGV